MQAYVSRSFSIFCRVKLLSPMDRIFPLATMASNAAHVSSMGTSITSIRPVFSSRGWFVVVE